MDLDSFQLNWSDHWKDKKNKHVKNHAALTMLSKIIWGCLYGKNFKLAFLNSAGSDHPVQCPLVQAHDTGSFIKKC